MRLMIDGINIFNPLEGKMEYIVDTMVALYGEEYRNKIESNLSKTEFFFVPINGFGQLSDTINSFYEKKREDLRSELYSLYSTDERKVRLFSYEKVEGIIKLNESFINNDINDINKYKFESLCKFLDISVNDDVNVDLNTNVDLEMIRKMINKPGNKAKLQSFFDDFNKNYQTTYKSKFDAIDAEEQNALKEVEQVDAQISSINEDYKEKERNFALKVLSNIMPEISNLFDFQQNSLVRKYIDLINNCYIKDSNLDFISNYQKKEYVEFFQKLGFNCGEDFEDYLSSKKVKDAVFSKQIEEEYKTLINKYELEKVNANPFFADAVKRIEKLDLETGSLQPIQSIYHYMKSKSSVGAYTQLFKTKSGEFRPICVSAYGFQGCDHFILHEMNHIVESSIASENEDNVIFKCGFDILNEKKLEENYEGVNLFNDAQFNPGAKREQRKYELLNEVINDYFALEITKKMHSQGIQLYPGKQGNNSNASYAYAFPLMMDFIVKNKGKLVKARMSNDENALAEIFGKDNAETLAKICDEHLKMAQNPFKFVEMAKEVMDVAEQCKVGIAEATSLDVEWSADVIPYIKHFQEINKITKSCENEYCSKNY